MCDVAAALMAAQGVAQYAQQSMQANALQAHGKDIQKLNASMAERNAFDAYVALADRQVQEHEAAARSIDEVSQSASKAQGLARVAAGEAGVRGGSLEALLGDFRRQALSSQSVTIRNRAYLDSQFARERAGVEAQHQAALIAGVPAPVQRPSVLNTLLQIGSGVGAHLYGSYFNQAEGKLELSKSPFAQGKIVA
jgi:hypothetical protein